MSLYPERGFREIVTARSFDRTQDAVERSRLTGFELTDEEELPGWGGPLLLFGVVTMLKQTRGYAATRTKFLLYIDFSKEE